MGLLQKLKGIYSLIKRQPEDDYVVIINTETVQVNHPWWGHKEIRWIDLQEIALVNTDKGPWFPDVWLTLVGRYSTCKIPQGAIGFDEVYNKVSTYKGFDFEKVIDSMGCTDNKVFILWTKNGHSLEPNL